MERRFLPWLAVVAAFVAAGYAITANLGDSALEVDEVFQIFAARSINAGHGPRLPSGELYERGLDVTRMVALSFSALGDSELTARLPSTIFGWLSLIAFATGMWWLAGPYAAAGGVVLMGFFPEFAFQSRHLRFYTYTTFFAVLAMFTGWLAIRRPAGVGREAPRPLRDWGWSMLTVALLLQAARAQVVALSVLAGFAIAVALTGLEALWRRRTAAFRESGHLQMTVAGLILGLLLVLARPDLALRIWQASQRIADWAERATGGTADLAYYYMLAESLPAVLTLAPVIFLVLAFRRPRLAGYLAIWVGVPLVLHSFVFNWKGARFVLPAMPGLFAATAVVLVWALDALAREVRTRLARHVHSPLWRDALAAGLVGLVAVFAVITTPGVQRSWEMTAAGHGAHDTRHMADIVANDPDLRALPVGGSEPMQVLYYMERLNFAVGRKPASVAPPAEDSTNAADNSAGVPVLSTPGEIADHFGDGAVLIATAGRELHPDLREALRSAPELCGGECGAFRLYYLAAHAAD